MQTLTVFMYNNTSDVAFTDRGVKAKNIYMYVSKEALRPFSLSPLEMDIMTKCVLPFSRIVTNLSYDKMSSYRPRTVDHYNVCYVQIMW